MPSRIAEFIDRGRCICPFAAPSVKHYVTLPDRPALACFSETRYDADDLMLPLPQATVG
jgi:hypothetical protein